MKDKISQRKKPKTNVTVNKDEIIIPNQIVSYEETDRTTTSFITADDSFFQKEDFEPKINDQDERLRRADSFKSDAENLTITEQYENALANLIYDQYQKAEVIENKLEKLIERQINKIKLHNQKKPNKFFSLPKQTKEWNRQLQKQQSALERLRERLRIVHEIKEKVTHEGPQLQLLAHKQLQIQNPTLVDAYIKERQEKRKKKLNIEKTNIYKKNQKRTKIRKLTRKIK